MQREEACLLCHVEDLVAVGVVQHSLVLQAQSGSVKFEEDLQGQLCCFVYKGCQVPMPHEKSFRQEGGEGGGAPTCDNFKEDLQGQPLILYTRDVNCQFLVRNLSGGGGGGLQHGSRRGNIIS